MFIVFSLPFVQSKLADFASEKLQEAYNVNIAIGKVDLSILGNVNLKDIKILDHHQDSLINVAGLSTSILSFNKIFSNHLKLDNITLKGVEVNMKTYKKESSDNLNIFIDAFDDGSPTDTTSTPFTLSTKNIYLEDFSFKLKNLNKANPIEFYAINGGGSIQDFTLYGSEVKMKVRGAYFEDDRGVEIKNFTTNFLYTKTKMEFLNTILATQNYSKLRGDVVFKYKIEDLSNFTDKVKVKANFKRSKVSLNDLNKIYGELKSNDMLFFRGNLSGTLNNFGISALNLYSRNGMRIKGDFGFVNSFNHTRGFLFDGDIENVTSNYDQLKSILPNILGKKLPTDFQKLGNFTLSGLLNITPDQINATVNVNSKIGTAVTDLQLTEISNIDKAKYSGDVELIDFDLGEMANDTILGKITLKAEVIGSGFNVDHVNTSLIGKIQKINFKGYTYKDLTVNGVFENRKFDGYLLANDDNFKLSFEGLADFSSSVYKFDFNTDIQKIDLKKTKLFTRDSIALVKGLINLDITGNTFDDIVGKATFNDVVYQNEKRIYSFKDFEVQSTITDSIKTISMNSKDIVQGSLKGKFLFKELFAVSQNALWSTYSNYVPVEVKPHQFIDFNFEIYNQIIELFFPQINLGENTKIKGRIDSDKNKVKLVFNSPQLSFYENVLDSIQLRIDNKNKLYTTYLNAQKISNPYYHVHDLSLINRTRNDTLFFKSTFKGGKKKQEDFNLDFFYTYNTAKESVLGIERSSIEINNALWFLNPEQNKDNSVVYNSRTKLVEFKPFLLESGHQKITFKGVLKDTDKDIDAHFTNVYLKNILPEIEGLKLEGLLNGKFKLFEKEGVIRPKGIIQIDNLIVNEFSQGTLKGKVSGDNSYEKFNVDLSIRDYIFDNVKAKGKLDFSSKKPMMDLDIRFKEYELNGFSDFFGGVISNIRGVLSGAFTAKGPLHNPVFNGLLNLNKSGLTVPYLNIDFDFIDNTDIELKGQSFIFDQLVLQDTKYDSRGFLSGSIYHQNFTDWFFDLDINSDNLLVLDTKEVEEIPYYGKGFLEGFATLKGSTEDLTIDVRGKTQKQTIFVIPLSDVASVDSYKLIHFNKGMLNNQFSNLPTISSGVKLNIDLEVTKDAVAQIVIDKVNKSELKGSGTGDLQIAIDTRGEFTMEGGLAIDNGVYNFRYAGIPKKFAVQKGGTISWSGDPYQAELDLIAIYQAKANPAQFIDNVTSTRKIPVNLYTKITGGLFDSKQEFDIKIPSADSNVASELEFRFENNTNSKMLNFASLLLGNTFYNEETSVDFASNIATSTASDVLSNVLSNMINTEGNKIKLNVGYTQADRSNVSGIIYDDQVDVSVSSKLSDKVIFNGKVGVPVGANSEIQTGVVGEAKLEVLLNDQGTLRWNIFNKPNDIQYSVEEEGYTQGTGFSYQVNFNNLNELGEKLGVVKSNQEKKVKSKIDSLKINKRIKFIQQKTDTTNFNNEKKNK